MAWPTQAVVPLYIRILNLAGMSADQAPHQLLSGVVGCVVMKSTIFCWQLLANLFFFSFTLDMGKKKVDFVTGLCEFYLCLLL